MRNASKGTRRPQIVAGYFTDPETGERLADHETIDAHGTDLVGVDGDGGLWWGTERAAWVLHEHAFTVIVRGTMGWPGGRRRWTGRFVGTEEAAIHYAETHSVVVDEVESGDPAYEERQLKRYRQRQVAKNLATKPAAE